MRVGFTGTRIGMTHSQKHAVRSILGDLESKYSDAPNEIEFVVHGCCVGADADFDAICLDMGYTRIGLPSTVESMRSTCNCDFMAIPTSPLSRNVAIASNCDVLLACPKEAIATWATEPFRGGTWHTIRQARIHKKRIIIIWPDGTFKKEIAK